MKTSLSIAAIFSLSAAWGAKAPALGEAANKAVKIEAKAYLDKDGIQEAVGGELSEGVVVIELTVTPQGGGKLQIEHDDFLLRSDRDGQRSTPYSPSQIAGSSVLMVRTTNGGGAVTSESRGPVWGGIGGRPSRMPSPDSTGIGNSAGQDSASASQVEGGLGGKADPMLVILKQKILREDEVSKPASGQLYFLLEGKHKPKHIELIYKTADGRLSIRFREPGK